MRIGRWVGAQPLAQLRPTPPARSGYFLKKKLGLNAPDAELDKAIMAVGDNMKGDRTKNRVTVYYLLADHFGKLSTVS
jgi:hypothetical protein